MSEAYTSHSTEPRAAETPIRPALISASEAIVLGAFKGSLSVQDVEQLEGDFRELRVGSAATFLDDLNKLGREGFLKKLGDKQLADIKARAGTIKEARKKARASDSVVWKTRQLKGVKQAKDNFAEEYGSSVDAFLKRLRSPEDRGKLLLQFRNQHVANLAKAQTIHVELVARDKKLDTTVTRINQAIAAEEISFELEPDDPDMVKLIRRGWLGLNRTGGLCAVAQPMEPWIEARERLAEPEKRLKQRRVKLALFLRRADIVRLFSVDSTTVSIAGEAEATSDAPGQAEADAAAKAADPEEQLEQVSKGGRPGVADTCRTLFQDRRDKKLPLQSSMAAEARMILKNWPKKPSAPKPKPKTVAGHISALYTRAKAAAAKIPQ